MSQLANDGYVILRNVVTTDALLPIRELIDRIFSFADKRSFDPFYRYYLRHRPDQGVLYDLYQRHPEFQPLAKLDKVLDTLHEVLGDDIFLYTNSLIAKPKGRENGVPWHHDFISRPDEPIKYIVWIALDDATRENGCVRVLPGSHKTKYPWFTVKGETHHDRIDTKYIDEGKAVYAEMSAGDVLIFNMRVVHSSEEVHSDKPRRAFRLAYQGFEEIFTPRGSPIVVRGGSPESIEMKFGASADIKGESRFRSQRNVVVRFLNKIGRRLASL